MPKKILLLCLGNICRSAMAEYLARRRWKDSVQVESAGIYAIDNDHSPPHAVAVLQKEYGLDLGVHRARHLHSLNLDDYDYVISFDGEVTNRLGDAVEKGRLLDWQLADPYGHDYATYKRCAESIEGVVGQISAVSWKK